jgi:nucleotide-binding universal stress UspA family protein
MVMSTDSETIVAGFVDSTTGWAALERAVAEVRLRNGRLVVVHSMLGGPQMSGEEAQKYRELFAELEARFRREAVAADLRTYVRGRTPAEDVCAVAEDEGASLVVIGYRDRTATGKAILGSDALGILRCAPCPVLAVRA